MGMKDKVLRYKARRASPPGIPSMIVNSRGGYVRYSDFQKVKRDLKVAVAIAEELQEAQSDAINPCCS